MHVRWRGLELPARVEVDQKSKSDTFGRFIVEPFERGFGTTIGNSLRRILLSSVEGAAVVSARIQGVEHEILSRLIASHVDVGAVGTDLWLVDGTVVRAARCASGGGKEDDPDEPDDHGLGRSRGGFSTKIHLVSDDRGHPLAVTITPGQEHESDKA